MFSYRGRLCKEGATPLSVIAIVFLDSFSLFLFMHAMHQDSFKNTS